MNADVEKAVEYMRDVLKFGADRTKAEFERMAQALRDQEAEIAGLVAALKAAQWDCHGKCPVCAGWMCGPNGETRHAHTPACPVGIALTVHLGAEQ